MEIVKSKENLEHLNRNIKDDFYKVPNLNFDIEETFSNFIKCAKQNTLPIKEGQFVALGGLTKCIEIPFNTKIFIFV